MILPFSCINDVKSLPEDKVSIRKEIQFNFTNKVTNIVDDSPKLLSSIKIDLTRHLASVLDGLQDEIRYAVDSELGPCEDWTSQPVYSKLTRIVALLSGRVFVGRPLSRNEEWLEATINYTSACIQAINACKRYHPLLRNIVGPFLREVKNLKAYRRNGAELLKPLLAEVLDKETYAGEKLEPDAGVFDDEQGTFCSWMLKYMDPNQRSNSLHLATAQMACEFGCSFDHTVYKYAKILLSIFCSYPYQLHGIDTSNL